MLVNMGKVSVWFCGVSVSRVCVVCYSTHHRVMSQARDDFEGFLMAHMSEEEKIIVQVETSLLCRERLGLISALPSPTHSLTHSLDSIPAEQFECILITSFHLRHHRHHIHAHTHTHSLCPSEQCMPSRVRARFCTGVACHVSPHDM